MSRAIVAYHTDLLRDATSLSSTTYSTTENGSLHHLIEIRLETEKNDVPSTLPEGRPGEISLPTSEPTTEEEVYVEGRAGRPEGDPTYSEEE